MESGAFNLTRGFSEHRVHLHALLGFGPLAASILIETTYSLLLLLMLTLTSSAHVVLIIMEAEALLTPFLDSGRVRHEDKRSMVAEWLENNCVRGACDIRLSSPRCKFTHLQEF